MAQRRLFSQQIVTSDAFLDMPVSAQCLYFHLGMNADDDGFVNPKKIMRIIGSPEDDLKILLAKRFLLPFETGVVVIKHWLIHNTIRMDRYKPTLYTDEKNMLFLKENKAYTNVATNGLPLGNQMEPQVKLSKVKLSKEKREEKSLPPKIFSDKEEQERFIQAYLKGGVDETSLRDEVQKFIEYYTAPDERSGIQRWEVIGMWNTDYKLRSWIMKTKLLEKFEKADEGIAVGKYKFKTVGELHQAQKDGKVQWDKIERKWFTLG